MSVKDFDIEYSSMSGEPLPHVTGSIFSEVKKTLEHDQNHHFISLIINAILKVPRYQIFLSLRAFE